MTIDCQSCGASLSVEAHLRTVHCPYCDSPSIVERPATRDRPDPEFVVAFVIQQEDASERVKRWIKNSGFFTRSDFKRSTTLAEKTRGVYLPAYLYGAAVRAEYTADIGENYTETYTTVVNGKVQTRTRTKTEWRSLSGSYARYIQDILVTASKSIKNDQLEAIEPFDLRALLPYDPKVVAGWIAEEPTLTPEECQRLAHDESMDSVGKSLGRFMPGDSHRNLQYSIDLHQETLDLVLLPVWAFATRYAEDKPPVQIFVNGQTGEVHGKAPKSWIKITLFVLFILALIGGIVVGIMIANGAL